MANPQPVGIKFKVITTFTILAAAGSLAALYPAAVQSAHSQASRLVQEGSAADPAEAEANYRLATWLSPHDTTAWLGLARTQITNGRPTDAVQSLRRAGEGNEAKQLEVRTLIELGRHPEAAEAATSLTASRTATDTSLTLAALAYAQAGRPADIQPLVARVTSLEARQRILRAQAGNLHLASELYATGLLRSSSAILLTLPGSYERNLLLARIFYIRHTPASLTQAAGLLTTANSLNPSNLEARQLLADVYTAQSKTAESAKQTGLINKIKAGRP